MTAGSERSPEEGFKLLVGCSLLVLVAAYACWKVIMWLANATS